MAWHLFNEWGKHFEGDLENPIVNTEWLKQRLIRFINANASDKKFLRALILEKDDSDDFHDWQGLKFFLANYEEELRNQSKESLSLENILSDRDKLYSNDFYHKEHIWSIKHYPEPENEELDFNKRRLGNFVLLKETNNIKVSNEPPQQKVTLYFEDKQNEPNTRMIRELKDWFDKAQNEVEKYRKRKTKNYWIETYQKFFDKREQELVRFALKRWRLDGLPNRINDLRINSFKETNEIWEVIN